MKINYDKIRKTDKVVNIDPIVMSVQIYFVDIKNLYLTPLEALLYAVVKKYGNYRKDELVWVKIPATINGIFRHFYGYNDINQALDSLVEKRLLIEAEFFPSQKEDINDRIFRLGK
jgi:hypothetical protein